MKRVKCVISVALNRINNKINATGILDTAQICKWMIKLIALPQTHSIGRANVMIAPQHHSIYREINMQMI